MESSDQIKSANLEWYNEPKYNFYWNNYNKAFNLQKETNLASNRILENFNRIFYASKEASKAAHNSTIEILKNLNRNELGFDLPYPKDSSQIKNEKRKKPKKLKFQFELNEDLIKFYEESVKFKREKEQREKKGSKQADYVDGEQVNLIHDKSTSNAPFDRAGFKREEELKTLYGDKSTQIHLIETNIQLKYDKNFDLYQPKFWPSFPLKIKFN